MAIYERGLVVLLLSLALTRVAADGFCKFDSGDPTLILPSPASTSQLFIKGGTVVNADMARLANVYIEDGIIRAVGPDLKVADSVKVVDATGKYVMPGGIDPHTHMEMPFMGTFAVDDFYSGQAAALQGGTTMHIDFMIPVEGDLIRAWERYEKITKISVMDFGLHMAVNTWNEKVAADMEVLVQKGVNSFKFFMAYKGQLQVSDEQLLQGLARCKELGALPMVHCENGDAVVYGQTKIFEMGITGPEGHPLSRPAVVEGEATSRAIKLAEFLNVPLYVVHVMSIDALEEVAKARAKGQRVVGEPVASGLALDDTHVYNPDFRYAAQYVMSPPIHGPEHRAALQKALANGVLQVVATDHAAFNSTLKAWGKDDFRLIPNGVNGTMGTGGQESGMMTPSDYVKVTSTNCAQVFNIYPQKGVIAVGSDADIIILDPKGSRTITAEASFSKMDTNIYEGWKTKGDIDVTISQGKVVYEYGKLNVESGAGRYIPMEPYMSLYDGLEKVDAKLREDYKAPIDRTFKATT